MTVYSLVSFAVNIEFGLPKQTVAIRNMSTPSARVPKTAIDKHRDFFCGKKEIGISKRIFRINFPASNTISHQSRSETHFCALVAVAFNRPHHLRPLA